MALPAHLHLPEGIHDLPTQAGGLSPLGGLRTGAAGAATPTGASQRMRRRAVLRGEHGLADRPVLVDWFPVQQLAAEHTAAARVRGIVHRNLLRLLDLGTADARTGYAISEAPSGVDLLTVQRAAAGSLPGFWPLLVAEELLRGLLSLLEQQQRRRLGAIGHGRIGLGNVFVGWDGSVQLLLLSPQSGPGGPDDAQAPELRLSPRLLSPQADVYSIGVLLRELLPQAARTRPLVARTLDRCLHAQPDKRPSPQKLAELLAELRLELQAPLRRAAALGDVLGQICPRAVGDLRDTDWGESTGEELPALRSSLAPLSTGFLPLSATWLRPTSDSQPPRRSFSLRGSLLWLGTLAAAGLLLFVMQRLRETGGLATAPLPTSPASPGSAPSPTVVTALRPAAGLPDPGLHPGAELAHPGSAALRTTVERVHLDGEAVTLTLRLDNTGPIALRVPLTELRLATAAPESSPIAPTVADERLIGPGRQARAAVEFRLPGPPPAAQTLRLTFSGPPDLRDAAAVRK